MAKQVKGARANKPNDSFGVINNPNLYKNKYREEVDKDDQDEVEQQTELAPEEESEATPKTESFASVQKEGESDAYKKRYDDLKRHYDKKLDEWKSERDALEAARLPFLASQRLGSAWSRSRTVPSFTYQLGSTEWQLWPHS